MTRPRCRPQDLDGKSCADAEGRLRNQRGGLGGKGRKASKSYGGRELQKGQAGGGKDEAGEDRGGGRARRMVTGHAALNRTELLGSSLLCSGLAWHKTLAQCTSCNTLHVRHT